jgi:hypothetical protein
MQVEVSVDRVVSLLAERLAAAIAENCRLIATNEVIIGRLQEYVERDRNQRTTYPQATQGVDDDFPTDPADQPDPPSPTST